MKPISEPWPMAQTDCYGISPNISRTFLHFRADKGGAKGVRLIIEHDLLLGSEYDQNDNDMDLA